ncbi:MAG: hypothetical protein EXR20_02025 [Bacteroidetes bacterium]|jgi:hypothetical protein|nr:hypothetical protein [Bacteroidota bacterium]PHX82267.1 MAG: hypothetical protein CK539_05540 [Flavobacteriales bacterium]
MPFSNGQISFALAFIAAFVIALIWAYKKDKKTNKLNFGAYWKILVAVLIIMATLTFILKNIHLH